MVPLSIHQWLSFHAATMILQLLPHSKLLAQFQTRSPPCSHQGAVLDQLAGEVHTLERKAAASDGGGVGGGDRGGDDNCDEPQRNGPDAAHERFKDQQHKELEGTVRGGDDDAGEVHRAEGVRRGSQGAFRGRDDLRWDEPPEEPGKNQEDGSNAGGHTDCDSERRCASTSTSHQAGGRGEPLDDHTNMGPGHPPRAMTSGELRSPEHMAERVALPTSSADEVRLENEEPAESARLRSELREARAAAEEFRGELAAEQKM